MESRKLVSICMTFAYIHPNSYEKLIALLCSSYEVALNNTHLMLMYGKRGGVDLPKDVKTENLRRSRAIKLIRRKSPKSLRQAKTQTIYTLVKGLNNSTVGICIV